MKLSVDIRKKLRDFVLDVNFSTRDEIFALLGASGCGKTITLKCIAGIETPDEGKIILNDRILFDSEKNINLPPQARRVGYLFQNYALFPNMTVAENILFAAVGDEKSKLRRLQENLERFQLVGLENEYPQKLSGGQQQRVAFARILMTNAEILLLDEPFAAIDSYLKWQIEMNLAQVLKTYNGAAIFVSHDIGEVYRRAKKIAVINRGKIDTINTTHEIFQNPKTFETTLIIGCKNISAAKKIDSHKIFAEDWQLNLNTTAEVPDGLKYAAIHAKNLKTSANGENIFEFEVENIIEDREFFSVMLRPKNSAAKIIRWDVDKNFWRQVQAENLKIQLPADKIILLEG
ncbi:MAG: ATP-binding cassette domain-containing protein [Selenomonadaceae bacterium]|nr:ATP-binding cassette domain-containing protein [Selenomonadaceae bacterium]